MTKKAKKAKAKAAEEGDAVAAKEEGDRAQVFDSLQLAHKCILNSVSERESRRGKGGRGGREVADEAIPFLQVTPTAGLIKIELNTGEGGWTKRLHFHVICMSHPYGVGLVKIEQVGDSRG